MYQRVFAGCFSLAATYKAWAAVQSGSIRAGRIFGFRLHFDRATEPGNFWAMVATCLVAAGILAYLAWRGERD